MQAITSYIVKSILVAGVLAVYYYIALRNKKFNAYNRFYLLAAMAASIVIPFVNLHWYSINSAEDSPVGTLLTVISASRQPTPFINKTPQLIYVAMAAISCILLIILAVKVAWVLNVKKRHQPIKMQGYYFIETAVRQAPFSFLDNLFWKKGISWDDSSGEKILKHELTHIKQKHTYDKLFTQIVVCIFWMNPFYWFMQKELNLIHEFMADEGSIDEGDAESFALMLLQSHNGGRYLNPTHSFFHSPVKRRLIMITTSKNTPYSYARRVLALPVAALAFGMLSFTVGHAQTNQTKDSVAERVIEQKKLKQDKLKGQLITKENGEIIIKGDSTKPFFVTYSPADSTNPKGVLEMMQVNAGDKVIYVKTKTGAMKQYKVSKDSGRIKLIPVQQ